jgi:hypothetical protein
MADTTRTVNTSTLSGYVSLDALRAGSQESKADVAGGMTDTLKQLADYSKRLDTLEAIAQKLIGG